MNARILNRNSAEPPADGWFQIEVAGEWPAGRSADGRERRQVIDAEALEAICNRFASEREAAGENWAGMLVDLDHLSHDQARSTEAWGWLQEVAVRNGQLWGKLDLSDLGEAAIRNKRVKWFSTEYEPGDLEDLGGGRVRPRRLAGLAFTNRPNNRGGRPISNRAECAEQQDPNRPGQQPGGQTETKATTMNNIADKLGLPADADEAAIIAAIEALQQKSAEMEADAVMNRYQDRVPADKREQVRKDLIANREGTERMLALMPAPQKEADPERIHNRAGGAKEPAPVGDGAAAAAGGKADAQHALVEQTRIANRCSFQDAWDLARRERPELFRN
jgi:hypothetical protein